MSVRIKQNYHDKLRDMKPIVIGKKVPSKAQRAMGAKVRDPIIIPPLNTDIVYSSKLPKYRIPKGLQALDDKILPETFNWRHENSDVLKPQNQMVCGSCWAIATASAVSDAFTISNLVDWKPKLSTTWILSCYPQNQCSGGNPSILLGNIQAEGIAGDSCVDYSWCSRNGNCNGKGERHFTEGFEMSSLIPPCGCYDPGRDTHYIYKIENAQQLYIGAPGVNKDNIASIVKKHIYQHGPILAGFIVYKNFINADFVDGLYVERMHHEKDKVIFRDNTEDDYVGSHLICILGWGVQKNVQISETEKTDVPFWYCRNSWGEKWNGDGYFKMPMYPYNKIVQFEKQVTIISDDGTQQQGGGILTFTVNTKPETYTFEQIPVSYKNNLEQSDDFYKKENKPNKRSSSNKKVLPNDSEPSNNTSSLKSSRFRYITMIILAVALLYIFLYRKLR